MATYVQAIITGLAFMQFIIQYMTWMNNFNAEKLKPIHSFYFFFQINI